MADYTAEGYSYVAAECTSVENYYRCRLDRPLIETHAVASTIGPMFNDPAMASGRGAAYITSPVSPVALIDPIPETRPFITDTWVEEPLAAIATTGELSTLEDFVDQGCNPLFLTGGSSGGGGSTRPSSGMVYPRRV